MNSTIIVYNQHSIKHIDTAPITLICLIIMHLAMMKGCGTAQAKYATAIMVSMIKRNFAIFQVYNTLLVGYAALLVGYPPPITTTRIFYHRCIEEIERSIVSNTTTIIISGIPLHVAIA